MEGWGNLTIEFQQKVDKLINKFQTELISIRQSGVDIEQVKGIQVEAYPSNIMPLYQLATINVKDALTVVILPWDKNVTAQIEKSIKKSMPNVRLATKGDGIVIGFPPLTEESLKIIIKKLHSLTEDFRQHLRKLRNHYKGLLDDAKNAKDISEDSYYRYLDKIDEITKKGREKIELLAKQKENKILIK